MLEEVLKHDKLGNREEILLFLFDALNLFEQQSLLSIRKYCLSKSFSMAHSFDGIAQLCEGLSFVRLHNEIVLSNPSVFDHTKFVKTTYFDNYHFFQILFDALSSIDNLKELFDENNIKYSSEKGQYFVIDNKIPFKFFSIRNLLVSTGFFARDKSIANHLFINKNFTSQFRVQIIHQLFPLIGRKRKFSLDDLKNRQAQQEEAGRLAELFVLRIERNRLKDHPELKRVIRISDESVDAGYDIDSFFDRDSITIDKFIEVKSFEGEISFYWSKGQVKCARDLKDKYFLFLIDRKRIDDPLYHPHEIQHP